MDLRNVIKSAGLLVVLMAGSTAAFSHYQAFHMEKADIKAVLNGGHVTLTRAFEAVPADITFGCADIKYNHGMIRFCECGDGCYMSLRACNIEFNDKHYWEVAPFWGLLWNYLKQFELPIWHVGDGGPHQALALDELRKCGGRYVKTLADIHREPRFKSASKKAIEGGAGIRNYQGIVVFRAPSECDRDGEAFGKFKRDHPEFLVVNAVARNYLKRKDTTYRLFTDAGLAEHIPAFRTYKSEYSDGLAARILTEFSNEYLVVKPAFSSCSQGVNIIHRHALGNLLQQILRDRHDIPQSAQRCLSYWRQARPAAFVVSECLESQIIEVGGKPYDPTMRVMYIMHHDKGTVHVNILGGFWKIPVKSLSDTGSLTEKRVTIAHAGDQYTGIMVDRMDANVMKQEMTRILTRLYETMLLQGPIA